MTKTNDIDFEFANSEFEGHHYRLGKWSKPGVPHKGWTCVDMFDAGAPDHECEMCETQLCRYVHVMQHPMYPDKLHCGCICAGHMEGDYSAAVRREIRLKSRARRRKHFPDRARWRVTARGNHRLAYDGRMFVVGGKPGRYWTGYVWGDGVKFSGRTYKTLTDAKLGVFDAVETSIMRRLGMRR